MGSTANALHMAQVQRRTVEILLQHNSQIDDKVRLEIIEMHERWQQKAYGNNQYVYYGLNPDTGRPRLYVSARSVPANAPPPDQTTSPRNWSEVT